MLWRLSDCEELVGSVTGDDVNDIKIKNFLKVLIVPNKNTIKNSILYTMYN